VQLTGRRLEILRYMFGRFGIATFTLLRHRLAELLDALQERRRQTRYFYAKLFLFFVALNATCYWVAMLTAFPEVTFGPRRVHYFWVQFPVGILGAVFDSLSLIVTVFMVRRALASTSNTSYVAHLSADIGIAVLATFWVLFVFSASGWMISLFGPQPESLLARNAAYQDRLGQALQDPMGQEELRNIYFGIIMGLSAAIPTLIHVYCSLRAAASSARGLLPMRT